MLLYSGALVCMKPYWSLKLRAGPAQAGWFWDHHSPGTAQPFRAEISQADACRQESRSKGLGCLCNRLFHPSYLLQPLWRLHESIYTRGRPRLSRDCVCVCPSTVSLCVWPKDQVQSYYINTCLPLPPSLNNLITCGKNRPVPALGKRFFGIFDTHR